MENEDYKKGYYDNNGRWVEPKRERWRDLLPFAIANALSLTIACGILDGMHFDSFGAVVFAALLLTLVNWSLKPVVHIISLPLSIFTFGIFALVINGLFLELVAALIPGFYVSGLWTAIWGSIIITLSNLVIKAILPK